MIGAEKCTTVCCGQEISMNETTRETNNKFLYVVNFTFAILGIILVALGVSNLVSYQLMSLFPFVEPVIVATIDMGALMLVFSVLGVLGTRWRSKRVLITWCFVIILVTISEIIIASVMVSSLSNNTYDRYVGTTFLANWKALVAKAETNAEDLAWIKGIQTEGACCGWQDAGDVDENPAWTECGTSYTTICSAFFKDVITSKFGSLQSIAMAIAIIQLLLISTVLGTICRFKEFYKGEKIDFGDYKHVPYGGRIKTLEELIA